MSGRRPTPMVTHTLPLAPPTVPAATGFEERLRALAARYRSLWWALPTAVPTLGETYSPGEQARHEAAADRHLATLERIFRQRPVSEKKRAAQRDAALVALQALAQDCLGYSAADVALLFDDPTLAATRAFVDDAQATAPDLPPEDLFQALRNVWVMHGLQLILGLEVATTPAVFAYSMLYPLTDNLMDDEDLSRGDKEAFSTRLGRRLAGQPVEPASSHESTVFHMVDLMEAEHPRAEAPEVWASLLAIQRAQAHSLHQHGRRSPYEVDVLGISIEKGGSSVLADGYLVSRTLSAADADFIFGFGVVLQLLDDLQDTMADRAARHATLFSQTAEAWSLDAVTSRLGHLMVRVLAQKRDMAVPGFAALMQRSCALLLLYAVAQHREQMSPAYSAALEAYAPLRLAYMAERRVWVAKRYGQLRRAHPGRGLPHPLLALLS